MITNTQVSKDLKLSTRTTNERFKKFGIQGKKRANVFYYTKEQIKQISYKKSKNPSYPALSHRSTYQDQVKIIEMYLSLDKINISEISRSLEINYLKCYKTIKEYEKRECLIIQSKL